MREREVSTRGSADAFPGHAGNSALRVGIFQAERPLQVHTVNPVLVLAENGIRVDLFLYRVNEERVKGELDSVAGVRVVRIGEGTKRDREQVQGQATACPPSLRESVRRACSRAAVSRFLWQFLHNAYYASYVRYYPVWLGRRKGEMPASVLRATLLATEGHHYRALIGVDQAGLVWAGQVGGRLRVPHFYHNLELVTRNFYGPFTSIEEKRLKYAERRYHRKSYATIVQNAARGEVLFSDNRVRPARVLYVPVSLLGSSREARTSFLQKRLQLGNDHIVILQFGWLSDRRLCIELAQLAQRFPDRWVLVMHGYGSEEYLQKIRAADTSQRVAFSLELVPGSLVPEVVASAHIGLVLYRPLKDNDKLTAQSSEKVALFLQCGIPIVALDNPGYEILELRRCGAVIKSLDELPAAVERILASWDEFSYNARALYDERYEFRANYRKVVDMLKSLP
jgi:hypothetical protein